MQDKNGMINPIIDALGPEGTRDAVEVGAQDDKASNDMLMNPATGSVYSRGNWLAEMSTWNENSKECQRQFDSLVKVVRDENGDWIEATDKPEAQSKHQSQPSDAVSASEPKCYLWKAKQTEPGMYHSQYEITLAPDKSPADLKAVAVPEAQGLAYAESLYSDWELLGEVKGTPYKNIYDQTLVRMATPEMNGVPLEPGFIARNHWYSKVAASPANAAFFDKLAAEFGSVSFRGVAYALTQDAYITGTHEDPRYEAGAITREAVAGTSFDGEASHMIVWDVLNPDCEDASDACNWAEPISVEPITDLEHIDEMDATFLTAKESDAMFLQSLGITVGEYDIAKGAFSVKLDENARKKLADYPADFTVLEPSGRHSNSLPQHVNQEKNLVAENDPAP